jgi:hypothetical protein
MSSVLILAVLLEFMMRLDGNGEIGLVCLKSLPGALNAVLKVVSAKLLSHLALTFMA